MADTDSLARAKALLGEARLARSAELKQRFDLRNARLERIARDVERKRQQALGDPLARALARMQALSDMDDDS